MAKKQRVDRKIERQQRLASSRYNIAKQSAAVLALGLGLTAVGPAEASIVYTAFDYTVIDENKDFFAYNVVDQFAAYQGYQGSGWTAALVNPNVTGNGVVVTYSGGLYAALLNAGAPIDATKNFNPFGYLGFAYYGVPYGPPIYGGNGKWMGKKGYLGLKFIDGSDTHYGWAEMEVSEDVSEIHIFGYAYETEANTPIKAGAVPLPGSLALLATGAAGLLAYRRKKRAA